MKQAIVLCSGGIDSVVTGHYVKKKLKYGKISILFFDYGQRNLLAERKCAKKCAKDLNADFNEIGIKYLGEISTSLLNSNMKHKSVTLEDLKDSKNESEKWYVPCRNMVFLSNAFAYAEASWKLNKKKTDIFVGFKSEGKESYPDTTIDFVDSLNRLSRIAIVGSVKVKAPLIRKDKEDILNLGKKIGVDFSNTFSCYTNSETHCGDCLACRLRQEGFYWANISDPTHYKKKMKDYRRA